MVFYVRYGRRGHLTWFHKIRFMLCYVICDIWRPTWGLFMTRSTNLLIIIIIICQTTPWT